jgi:hypothetical protein
MFQANVLRKSTHVLYSITLFFENHGVYETIWKNTVQPHRPKMTIWRMRIACRIPKATNTLSEYVIRIAFFTATMVTLTSLFVTSCLYCLSYYSSYRPEQICDPVDTQGCFLSIKMAAACWQLTSIQCRDSEGMMLYQRSHTPSRVVFNSTQLHFSIVYRLSRCYSSPQVPRK